MSDGEYRELILEMLRDLKGSVKDLDNKFDDLKEKFHLHCEDSKTQQLEDTKEKLKRYMRSGGLTLSGGGMAGAAVILIKWLLTGEV